MGQTMVLCPSRADLMRTLGLVHAMTVVLLAGFPSRISVPGKHFPSACDDALFHFAHEPGLQLVFLGVLRCILQSQLADLRLAFGTGFPAFFRTFVSSDVNIGRREDIHDFIEHILGELQGLFIPAAQHVGEDSD